MSLKIQFKKMKPIIFIIIAAIGSIMFSGCAITRGFGPYQGIVIDKDTQAPLEETAVLVSFWTEMPGPGGGASSFADAVETLTDSNGVFYIPRHRVFVFRPISLWNKHGGIMIFKPGYTCYPGCRGSSGPYFTPDSSIPENKFVTIKLSKLKTKEERIDNVSTLNLGVPDKKMKNMRRLQNIEAKELGLDLWPNP